MLRTPHRCLQTWSARTPTSSPARLGSRAGMVVLFLALVGVTPTPGAGQPARSQVEEGNRLYAEGRFEEAHQKYLEALLEDPESPLIRFNDGNALYQNQDFQQAMERFAEALESPDPGLRNSAWYNLGNALFRQQRLQESLEAFKEALRAEPGDADAKHNLERVLEAIQEQEQQAGDENEENQEEQDQSSGEENQENQDQSQPQGQESPQSQNQDEQENQREGDPQQGEAPPRDLEQEQQEGQSETQPQPGEMTPEEAERLLDAIREDPGDVNRKRVPSTGRRPRKVW